MTSYLRGGVHGKSVLIRLNNHVGQTITVRVQGTDTPNYDPRDGGSRKSETIQGLRADWGWTAALAVECDGDLRSAHVATGIDDSRG